MQEVLEGAGYKFSESAEGADIVVLNTCSVREKAEQKLRSEVGRLGLAKRERPEQLIVVAGCVAQQEGEKLLKRLPYVDLVIGPDNIPELPALIAEAESGSRRARTVFDVDAPHFLAARPREGKAGTSAYVTVMKGCDERCSYCIVPHTRGPERYRPAREIRAEVQALVAAGAKEITLLGQTVNSYVDPLGELPIAPGTGESPWRHTHASRLREDESQFAALLRELVASAPGLLRLRYTSPHPRHLTLSLVRAHEELPALVRHVHMPVQSGSDRVLRRMIRRYDVNEYIERTDALKNAVPGLTLSTDIIVGFPGEDAADFQGTLELVERIGFTGVFGFKYSQRPYTPALKLTDDVPEEEKSARLARLFALADRLRQQHLERLVGSEQAVLVEGPGADGGSNYTGRTDRNEIVHFASKVDPTGEVVRVRVDGAFRNSLAATLLDDRALPLERAPAESSSSPAPRVHAGHDRPSADAAHARRSLPLLRVET
jgi:tRNA-2-methylthio-N6-dimethylallyladenosine synthase